MPSYKLLYFGIPGRGELTRMLFNYGGIKFEDKRFGFEEWPAIKKDTPFGQFPVLEIDGVQYAQSVAMARYVANEVKLAGNNNLENLEIDAMVDTIGDFLQKIIQYAFVEKDEAKKEELHKEIVSTTAPFILGKLEAIAKQNGGYLALKRLTWADIFFVVTLDNVTNYLKHDVFAGFPNLLKVKKTVLAVPSIKEYIKNRPPNPMGTFYDISKDL